MTMPSSSSIPDETRIDPRVLSIALLDEIAVGINKLLELTARTVPEGETLFISRTLTTEVAEEEFGTALFSVVISNDGPDSVEFCVNSRIGHYAVILSGETVPINMGVGKIKSLYLRSQITTAFVRLIGVY